MCVHNQLLNMNKHYNLKSVCKKNKIEMERGKEGDRQMKREREVERVRKIDLGTGGLNL